MKKSVVLIALALLFVNGVAALSVTTEDQGSVIIKELGNPAVFSFDINSGTVDSAEIYTFLGFTISPRGNFDLVAGNNPIEVKFYPQQSVLDNTGYYTFEYQIKSNAGIYKENLRVKFVNLERIISITVEPVSTQSNSAVLHIRNTENAYLENVLLDYNSVFFKGTTIISLKPFEEQSFVVPINQEAKKGLHAGDFLVTNVLKIGTAKATIEGNVEYSEKEDVSTNIEKSGILVRKTTIIKTNTGNVDTIARLEASKDVLSRLFTSLSIEPMNTERSGLGVKYSWESKLAPGEAYSASVTTNYTLPFIVIVLIVVVVLLVKMSQNTKVVVKKTVSFVKTKGGEFALKVTLHVRANKQADNLQLIDPLPVSLKLFENYGKRPDSIDAATRRMTWNVGSLSAGEERVFSYIAYSKIRVVGRFELPSALAVFTHNGATEEIASNRAFFVSELMHSQEI
jgi:hypothetical protein